jgi:hypothetical protein
MLCASFRDAIQYRVLVMVALQSVLQDFFPRMAATMALHAL